MRRLLPAIVIGGIVVVGGSVAITAYRLGQRYLNTHSAKRANAIYCASKAPTTYTVTIRSSKATPAHTTARLCDILAIINQDTVTRDLAFGTHEHHTPYNGVTEKTLNKGDSLTVQLSQTGTYTFHDHFDDTVTGDFTVTK